MKFFIDRIHLLFSTRVLVFGGFLLFAILAGTLFTTGAFADDPSANNDQRLVTIHDGVNEVTIVTRAMTVKDALAQAEVSVGEVDIVEPARNEKLVAQTYQVNVFRARPVVVVDGAQSIRIMTAEQSARQIAKAAGVTLYDEDQTELVRVDDVLSEGGAGLKLVIDRATPFYFTLFGKRFESRTQATTVEGLLKEKNITLGSNDGVSPAPETPLIFGAEVRVWRNGTQTVTQEEVIAKQIEEIKDTARELGYREVKTAGADGLRNVTYEIEMRDGVEVSRKEIASVVTREAVKEVVIVGVKVALPPGSHTDWMAAAGIAEADYGYVDYIVSHESGWGFTKYNYGGSGAYGLCQALPATKMASAGDDYMTNPITQLRWCNSYAISRYGSWAGAYNFWIAKHWW